MRLRVGRQPGPHVAAFEPSIEHCPTTGHSPTIRMSGHAELPTTRWSRPQDTRSGVCCHCAQRRDRSTGVRYGDDMTTTQRPRTPRRSSPAPGPNPANRGLLLVGIAVAIGLILLIKSGGIGFD